MVCWDTSHTPPLFGGALPLNFTPHTQSSVPCALLFSGISVSYVGPFFPSVEGFGGVPPISWGGLGTHQLFSCPYAHSGTFFVVHYGSHLLRLQLLLGYSGIFWPVFHVISDSGSFPDRVSSMPWHGSTPPLMPRGSGGVLGSISVPQQQTSSSMPPLAYANYAMGSLQVGFFFRVEPPIILYLIYVWCLFWCLLFTFRCRVGCCIHLWGLNH